MRAKGVPIQQLLLALALLAGVCWNLARADELRSVSVDAGATGTRAELQLDREVQYRLINLSNPERLVVDLPGVGVAKALALPAGTGLVRSVRSGQPVAGTTRIVFDLSERVAALRPRFEPGANGPRLVLEWPGDGVQPPARDPLAILTQGATTQPPAQPVAVQQPVSVPQPVAVQSVAQGPVKTVDDIARRAPMRPLIIAIDAGHGGQDPGARGAKGTREKDITLKIARELARQVDATPGLKAYLTRDGDHFIPLAQRYQKARAAKADLFVSIHADSFTSPSASGSSVFVLTQRGATSQAARWLANQENAADLVGGVKLQDKSDTLASVLLDLSQSATMKASRDMAEQVLAGLKRLGKTHKNHVEAANFVVLRSPDVPSMLVETAFISNPEEERKLNDPGHQARLAQAILNGVTSYFSRQPPPGTLYAMRAEAQRSGRAGGSP